MEFGLVVIKTQLDTLDYRISVCPNLIRYWLQAKCEKTRDYDKGIYEILYVVYRPIN